MKILVFILGILCLVLFSKLSSTEEALNNYKDDYYSLVGAVQECNSRIEEAQLYAGESCEDMDWALWNLSTVTY